MTYADVIAEDKAKAGQYEVDCTRDALSIDMLILHHGEGVDRSNFGDEIIIDEISNLHKERFYKNGAIPSRHTHRFRDMPVYCAYQFLARPYTGGAHGWRITPTMWGVEYNTAGGTSMFLINRRSIQICILGDYRQKYPVPGLVDSLVDFFKPLIDEIKNHDMIEIIGHKAIDDVECPGMITDYLPILRQRLL